MPTAPELQRTFALEDFLRVVDRVYAAGCAEASWDQAVAEVCRVGGFDGGVLSGVDPVEPRALLRTGHGLCERAASAGGFGRMPRNPLLTDEVLRSQAGSVWHDRQITPPALLATTPFWRQWMEPNGFASWACVIVGKEHRQVICLEVYKRPEGASGALDGVGLLVRLAPHLTRAWGLDKTARSIPQHDAAPLAASSWQAQPAGPAASQVTGMAAMIRLRSAFGLSKAEARLALYLAAGASLPSMAEAFDVKLTTIRSQLQQVFSKTGTSRQAELVAFLLSRGYVDPIEPGQQAAGQRSSDAIRTLQQAT
jgi:DNA-binding CsgD family transcriptional regulator